MRRALALLPAILLGAILIGAGLLGGCRTTYVAPPARRVTDLRTTAWGNTDSGDVAGIREAEQACVAGLSPRAVASAFRAVDQVADAMSELCSIGIVDNDPLLWHVWCRSDALFQSGHYLPPEGRSVQCEGGNASTAFECIGRILGRHLLSEGHVQSVELVSIGSVDQQRIATEGAFLTDPCTALQERLSVPSDQRFATPEAEPSEEERAGLWNQRLSWCRAAAAAEDLGRGLSERAGRMEMAAIGAGTSWLRSWRAEHRGQTCPTAPNVSGERQPGQCRDARRVDLFVRVNAQVGSARDESCEAPTSLPGGEAGRSLYCYADCQARAAVGRNPQGYRAPHSRTDVLFGSGGAIPEGWIAPRPEGGRPLNMRSVSRLLSSP